jgi:hypothetical protein
MPWERGEGSVEVEMSRIQGWIESTDPELHGNSRKGLIQQFWEDRSFIKGALWVLMFLGGGDFIIQILRFSGIVK